MAGFVPAIIAEFFFAFAGIFYKVGLESEIHSLTLVYGRLFTASLILCGGLLCRRIVLQFNTALSFDRFQVRSPAREDWWWFALLGLFFPASTLFLCVAIQSASLATSNLLHNLTPVFITLFCLFILRKPSNKYIVAGLGTTFVGLICLEYPELQANITEFLSGGSVIAIVSALANACHILIVGKLKQKGYSNFTILFWMSLLGTIYLLPIILGLKIQVFPSTTMGWLLIFGLGLLVQLIAQFLMLKSLNILPPEVASSFFLLEPVMATVLGYVFFAEKLTGLMLLGFVTILSGLLILCAKRETTNVTIPSALEPELIR